MTDQEYLLLKRKLLKLTGMNLEHYKPQQMRRRLDGFIANKADNVVSYLRLIEGDEDAIEKLKKFLTINVSEFFRDAEHFNQLKSLILPDLLKKNLNLRIWSAGCSHGAEPYSLAIALDELSPGGSYRILGTDLDERILAKARAGGPYTSADLKNVPRSALLKYFTPSSEGHMVNTKLLPKITFKHHNLLTDPYERGFDVIVCRNVIIYFTDDAKNQQRKQ